MKDKLTTVNNGHGRNARRVLRRHGGSLIAALLLVICSGAASALDFDVKAAPYSAVGDGSADDSGAIQQAVNDAAAQGGTVLFPYGRYRLARPLLLKSNVSLVSYGAVLTRLAGDSGTNTLFLALYGDSAPLTNVTFDGLVFEGAWSKGSSGGATAVTIEGSGRSGIRFRNCIVRQCAMGLFFNFASFTDVSIEGCTFQGNGGASVAFKDSSGTGIRISNSQFSDCYNGIQVSNGQTSSVCNGVTIQNCYFDFRGGSNYPIQFGRTETDASGITVATDVVVEGCTINGPRLPHTVSWSPFTLGGGTADQCALYNVRGFRVTNNVVTGGGDSGIVLQDAQNGVISGNICSDHYGVGILVGNGSLSNIDIFNNSCENNGLRPTDLPITPAAGGILVYGATNVRIQGNRCPASAPTGTSAHGQPYGLVLGSTGTDVIVGANDFAPQYPGQAPGGTYLGTGIHAAQCTDAAPPTISGVPSGPLVVTATSSAGAEVSYNFSATAFDQVDGAVPVVADRQSGTTFRPGVTTVNYAATDKAGNSTRGSFTVKVLFECQPFLEPINTSGDRSIFKLGRTVPVKFQLTGSSSGIDLSSVARLSWKWIGSLTAGEQVNETAGTEGSTTAFRYDASSGQHIYNLGTKGWQEGWHELTLDVGDGNLRKVVIGLRD